MNRHNRNNRRNFLNVCMGGRLLLTFGVLALMGVIHHFSLMREHLQIASGIDNGEFMDDPASSRVDIQRKIEWKQTIAPKKEAEKVEAVAMTELEYLQNIQVGDNKPEEKEPSQEESGDDNDDEDDGNSGVGDDDDKELGHGEENEVKSGDNVEKQIGEEPEKNEDAEKPFKRPPQNYEEPKQCERKENQKRLNVALFYADDWTMKVLGKFDQNVKTPNIDKMAENGMIFTNNCVTTSICWASRATLATGAYLGIHKHNNPFDDVEFEYNNWSDTLYPLMKKGSGSKGPPCRDGYYSGLFGKWHSLEIEAELSEAFDQREVYYGEHWFERNGNMIHVTEANKIDSIKFLKKWDKKFQDKENRPPFFLTTSFFATHAQDGNPISYEPMNSTRRFIYPDSIHIPPPKTATEDHYQQLPHFLVKEWNEGRARWRNRFEPKDFQKNIKDMYAMATEVDEAVGAIIEKIKALGVYDETVLIFTTDNGNLAGEHGLAEKWYPFEESLRVPLVIQDPRMPENRRGTMSDAWTLNVDLAPTILGIAGVPPSDFMQGRDIADLYLNNNEDIPDQASLSTDELKEKVKWRKEWIYEFNLGKRNDGLDHPWKDFIDASFALISDEWKYVYWPQHDYEQLFHRSVDPFDEWDLLNKIFRHKSTENDNITVAEHGGAESRKIKGIDNKNGCCDTVQTTMKMYKEMKERYAFLKEHVHSGKRI